MRRALVTRPVIARNAVTWQSGALWGEGVVIVREVREIREFKEEAVLYGRPIP